jgi:cation-dependent mannose-6-phosphate receptor
MRVSLFCVLVALLQSHAAFGASSNDKSKPIKPCTIRSPSTDRFFDLNPIHISLPESGKKAHKDDKTDSWHAKGYDYGANFTINFCGPVVEELDDVVDLEKSLWKNVSAFYKMDGKQYSIGYVMAIAVVSATTLLKPFIHFNILNSRICLHQFQSISKVYDYFRLNNN